MLLAAAAMVLSLVEVVLFGCSFVGRWVLGSSFILLSRVLSRLFELGRCVFPPKSRFAKRVSLVLQNEARFSEKNPSQISGSYLPSMFENYVIK